MRLLCVLMLLLSPSAAAPHRARLMLLGVTGGGKSTLGNTLLGREVFKVGHTLDSCTVEVTNGVGPLFGASNDYGVEVDVSDTGGLGDSEGRDEEFVDDVAARVRLMNGVHGFVYVHNACETRLSEQVRKSIATTVATLTDADGKKELADRILILMTRCTFPGQRSLYEKQLPRFLCDKNEMCNVPILWFDDFDGISIWDQFQSLAGMNVTAWRDEFAGWVKELPSNPMNVPSESEREKVKREYKEDVAQKEKRVRDLQDKIASTEKQLKDQAAAAKHKQEQVDAAQRQAAEAERMMKEQADEARCQAADAEGKMQRFQENVRRQAAMTEETLQREMRELKRELRDAKNRIPHSSCFSPDSLVIDRALGQVMMKDLVVGSEVATADGWSTVTTFLHWHPNATVRALKIVHDHGILTLSPEHMVFAISEDDEVARDVPAVEIEAGSMSLQVAGPKGELVASFVHSVESTTMQGYYAPLTSSGTILVNNVVASCYTKHSV